MSENHAEAVLMILGNQLFPAKYLKPYSAATVFMAEDLEQRT